jgi:hypothetical protein
MSFKKFSNLLQLERCATTSLLRREMR